MEYEAQTAQKLIDEDRKREADRIKSERKFTETQDNVTFTVEKVESTSNDDTYLGSRKRYIDDRDRFVVFLLFLTKFVNCKSTINM